MRSQYTFALPFLVALSIPLAGCLTNTLDPAQGGVFACIDDSECPESQVCLQKVCETIDLPEIRLLNPEDEQVYPYMDDQPHPQMVNVSGSNLTLRSLADSKEAVPGEGHLVVFVDEEPVATIDQGDISGGVLVPVMIPGTPGVHRIRVQARLNDGTDYDNETAHARNLVWVDDGHEHVALRRPWPNDTFGLEAQTIEAEVATFGGIEIGPPMMTGKQHVHVYYGVKFPTCLVDPACVENRNGVVPDNMNEFGPVQLPAAAAGMVRLTALVAESTHFTYEDDMGEPVFSDIMILRSDNQ